MIKYFLPKIVWLLFLVFSAAVLAAQTPRLDSLKKSPFLYSNTAAGLKAGLAVCAEYFSVNPDTLYSFATRAKAVAITLKDSNAIKWASYYVAMHFLTKGKTDSSMAIAGKELEHLTYGKDGKMYAKFILLKGRCLNNTDRPKESLAILFALLGQAEKQGDTLIQAGAMNTMVGAYVALGQDEQAKAWCYKTLYLLPQPSDVASALEANSCLSNLSLSYLHLYENQKIKPYLDSAVKYNDIAIEVCKKYQVLSGFAYNLGLKGGILSYQKKFDAGEDILLQSLAVYKQVGNIFYIINTMSILGNFYILAKQPLKGIAICREGISFSKDLKPNFYIWENLANNYKLAGNYQAYGETMGQLLKLKDSMYTTNSAQALSKLQADYELQKKENLIIQQKLDITKKNNLLYGSTGILALVIFGGWVFFAIRKKNQVIKMAALQTEARRKTMAAVLGAEENERRRIAADLHDSVAQKMVVAKINLETLGHYLPEMDTRQQQVYNNIFSLVDESCTDVRELSHNMMPQAFFTSGLNVAIKNFIEKIDSRGLQFHFNAEGGPEDVGTNTQVMAYRILQEVVQNILKHAKATRVDISMMYTNGDMDITIEDNGVGFDTGMVNESAGMKGMRSRIEILNGTMEIQSAPGKGTAITFFIPAKQS